MFAETYSASEMMAVACAKEIKDYDVTFVGVGVPMMAGLLATKTHAPHCTIVYEAGGIGAVSRRMPWTISDNPTTDNALAVPEMWRIFSDTQAGFVNKGVVGGAQVDKYGNLNTTAIFANGKSYAHPQVRLPGSGGANDIASSCTETIIMMRLAKGKFIDRVDYITSPGYLDGPGARERAGLRGKGPISLVSDKCIFRFDPETKEMVLDTLFPGSSVEDIKSYIDWDLRVAPVLRTMDPPLEQEVRIMRTYDPIGVTLGSKKVTREETFDDFYHLMKSCYDSILV
jgi:glutaconate CoA-transferase subunit B